jgi:hypothetical protein
MSCVLLTDPGEEDDLNADEHIERSVGFFSESEVLRYVCGATNGAFLSAQRVISDGLKVWRPRIYYCTSSVNSRSTGRSISGEPRNGLPASIHSCCSCMQLAIALPEESPFLQCGPRQAWNRIPPPDVAEALAVPRRTALGEVSSWKPKDDELMTCSIIHHRLADGFGFKSIPRDWHAVSPVKCTEPFVMTRTVAIHAALGMLSLITAA